MKPALPRSDIARALASLRDFQRDTAEYVFDRLYGSADPCRRILVSDEVGLGKTFVARGVIAKALEHLWDRVERIDIVYICSNAAIARQNVNRLGVLGGEDYGFRSATRLTLLATEVAKLGNVNFVALTPSTSFDLGSSLGTAGERALLYWLLKKCWGFRDGSAPYNVLCGNADRNNFKSMVERRTPDNQTLAHLSKKLATEMDRRPGLSDEFEALCATFGRSNAKVDREDRKRRNAFIGSVRRHLARVCIGALSPDIVILDEFQRFKDLLGSESEASELAGHLFDYQDEHSDAKVILLSATPYKMLTMQSGEGDEDHYRDFLKTLEFLVPDKDRFAEYRECVVRFRRELLRLPSGGDVAQVDGAKRQLETMLRKVIVRTERLAATTHRGGMLIERPLNERLEPQDLRTYIDSSKVAAVVGHEEVIEFWKSAPYFFSFLDGYKLRDDLRKAESSTDTANALGTILRSTTGVALPLGVAKGYQALPPANARMRGFEADYLERDPWKLLWIPPSLPYYRFSGSFAQPDLADITKRLIFSAWRMVPRSICTIVGHNTLVKAIASPKSLTENPDPSKLRLPSPLLRFQRDADKRLTGMPLFSLIYPSWALVRRVDPLLIGREYLREHGELPDLRTVRDIAKARIGKLLEEATPRHERTGHVDDRWYGLAPALLDMHFEPAPLNRWRETNDLSAVWLGEEEAGEESTSAHWGQHVREFENLIEGSRLGRMPDDLPDVLADIALAGPATAALRALSRSAGKRSVEDRAVAMSQAASIGWGMRNLMNLPESIAILRRESATDPYWRRVLEYCAEGCLQATLDEYVHVLVESLGVSNKAYMDRTEQLGKRIRDAIGTRPASIGIDEFQIDGGPPAVKLERVSTRFAMPLVEERATDTGTAGDDVSAQSRISNVSDAFNSPFWPFILASTSIGQEGLDFHPYCHAVVHWNLPSNPVDLEQREGRVHRYKGHAVRKNVAAEWGNAALLGDSTDVWGDVFNRACEARPADSSDLVPYWIYPVEGGASIERHVPGMPLSREASRIIDLRKTLAVYRMVFGQPRQEDLLEYLMSLGQDNVDALIKVLRIDLSPPCSSSRI